MYLLNGPAFPKDYHNVAYLLHFMELQYFEAHTCKRVEIRAFSKAYIAKKQSFDLFLPYSKQNSLSFSKIDLSLWMLCDKIGQAKIEMTQSLID